MNEINSISEMAELFEVSRPTVLNWIEEGMPYEMTGLQDYKFKIKKVLPWLRAKNARYARWIEKVILPKFKKLEIL